jgi:peptidyl-prolyl cis-trans isomerase SurA
MNFNYIYKLFTGITFLFLSHLVVGQPLKNNVIDEIICKVDNQILLKSELEFTYWQLVASGETPSDDMRCQIFQTLVINKLLLAKAEMDSVSVEPKIVEDQLEARMKYFIAQIGSKEKLEEYYNKSVEDMKNDLRKTLTDQLLVEKMQTHITKGLKVTPSQVKDFFDAIPKDSLPFYPTEVEVGQIVKLPGIGKDEKFKAKQKLIEIRTQILNGANFGELAKKHSEDPGSARDGGNLGFFKKGELVPEYEATALKLKPNEISNVIESAFGFHLIQMIERKGDEFNTRHILIKPTASQFDAGAAITELDSIRTLILNNKMKFDKAAKDFSDDKITKQIGGYIMDNETGSTKISMDKLDPTVFFVIDTMEVGSISTPLPYRTEDGKDAYRILYYKSKTPPHIANLKDDYQKIYTAALNDKKNNALNTWFEKAVKEVFFDVDEEYQSCEFLKDFLRNE